MLSWLSFLTSPQTGPFFWPPGFMWHTRPFIPQQRSLGPREWSISSSSHRPPRWPSTRWAVEQAIWIQSAMGKLEERWEIKGSFLAPIARIGIIVINNVWLLYHRPILGESARIKCWQQKGSSSKEDNRILPYTATQYILSPYRRYLKEVPHHSKIIHSISFALSSKQSKD